MSRTIEISAGGRRVPLNEFARDIILNALLGLLKSLKGADPEQEITIRVGWA